MADVNKIINVMILLIFVGREIITASQSLQFIIRHVISFRPLPIYSHHTALDVH